MMWYVVHKQGQAFDLIYGWSQKVGASDQSLRFSQERCEGFFCRKGWRDDLHLYI